MRYLCSQTRWAGNASLSLLSQSFPGNPLSLSMVLALLPETSSAHRTSPSSSKSGFPPPATRTHTAYKYPRTRALYSTICSGCRYISPVTEAPCCTRTLSPCIRIRPSIGTGGRSCGASLGYPLLRAHLRIVREEREGRGHSAVSDPAEGETDRSLMLHGWDDNDWGSMSRRIAGL
ncbi:hypothetical protein DFH09DRAFT_92947 [Mycena vulgaris]|nr:hypothetical protein DFH09DRAFT_92947 [Mycena vulgaris]